MKAADLHRLPIFPRGRTAVQCDRGRNGGRHTGAWCTQATVVEGQDGHRPKPARAEADGRSRRVQGNGRSQTEEQRLEVPNTVEGATEAEPLAVDERSGPTGGTAEAEPGVETELLGPESDRDRTEGRGRHAWVRMKVGKRQLPARWLRRRSPEGEFGRGYLTDASHDTTPEGAMAAQGPGRCPVKAEAMIGRPRRPCTGTEIPDPGGL